MLNRSLVLILAQMFALGFARADCWDQYGKMACGENGTITCRDKYAQFEQCRQAESAQRRQNAKAKELETLRKNAAEVDAVNKVNEANKRLNSQWERPGKPTNQ